MSELVEILITSDSNGAQCTCSAWDPRRGTNLMTYKGGGAAALHGFGLINNKFVITANSTKPTLHVWPTNAQDQVAGVRFVTPGKVSALAISPDGNYIVAGIQESIYVWQICSGKMLNVLSKHFQTISTIKFTDDGSHFVSSGQDGGVLVWNLTRVLNDEDHPFYMFNDHALPVTDIHIGNGGMRSILCTVSMDRSCRLYDLATGNLLLNLVFSEALTAVCLNILETDVFIGTSTGVIYNFNIISPPRMKEYHLTDEDYTNKFLGHKEAVTCLDLSLDGKILASGGHDENVYLWDISSKQLLRTLAHKGFISNLRFLLTSKTMFDPEVNFTLIAGSLKKMKDDKNNENDVVEIMITERNINEVEDRIHTDSFAGNRNCGTLDSSKSLQEIKALRLENEHLRKINKQLFDFSVNKILD